MRAEHRAPAGGGFTLIEVMVALVIFSLAALALLRLQGAAIATAARLEEKTIAAIVARNIGIETLLDPRPPAYGTRAGQTPNAGRIWRWTRSVARSPDPRLQRIDIAVAGSDGGAAATLTLVRRVA